MKKSNNEHKMPVCMPAKGTLMGTGEEAAAAAQQNTGAEKAPAAGEQAMRFQQLIKGEFKELYDESVRSILKQRLKKSHESEKELETLAPALKLLAAKYGTGEDSAALSAAIVEELDPTNIARRREFGARHQYELWIGQAVQAQEAYPDFELEKELCDHSFRELLGSGVPVKAAYELVHRDELMDGYAKELEESITKKILAGMLRPGEAALSAGCGAIYESDVAHMSKQMRRDIIKRVQSGEKIKF